jgi:hypothetical protein
MSDDRPADIGLWATVLVIVGAIVILFVVLLNTAKAEQIEATPVQLAFCALYARESARIDLQHTLPVNPSTVSDDYIRSLAVKVYGQCLSVLPTLLPLPSAHRDLGTWVADMKTLLVSRAGTEPAMAGDAEWRAQCERQYFTWDEATGTVIRAGNPARVRCPCGEEIDCQ